MKFQKTALATAVGATLAFSGVAQADGHSVNVYGRINNVIKMNEIDNVDPAVRDEDSTNVSDIVSRIGVKASAPIDANTTAFARYEFSTTTDSEGNGIEDTRIAEVGVSGDFGSAKIGNMWSTFYNMVGTHLDPTVTLGAVLYSTGMELPYRVSNAIQYSNSFGAVNFSAEVRIVDEDDPDSANAEKIGTTEGQAIGASVDIGDNLLVAVAFDSSKDDPLTGGTDDVDRTGFAVKWTQDNWWASLSYGSTDVDGDAITQTQLHGGMSFGDGLSGFIGYGMLDADDFGADDDPTAITLNVTKRFGTSGFRLYYEGIAMSDGDDVYGYDQDTHIFGARIDF